MTLLTQPAPPPGTLSDRQRAQLAAAIQGQKLALGKLISLVENPQPDAVAARRALMSELKANPLSPVRRGLVVGFTGTPGAGKSSLINELCQHLLTRDTSLTIAVLAVDPSSHHSGGAILGDRTRMRTQGKQPRLFFRSQASNLELGGVTHNTFQAIRLLRHLFDLILVETVGIGQNEVDIQHLTDHTFLVMQPLGGDQIQFMKCGIMEIPDSFIVNKCDEEKLARNSYYLLRGALKQARLIALDAPDDHRHATTDQVFLTSALRGLGLTPLADFILTLQPRPLAQQRRDDFYLQKAVQQAFGQFGLNVLATVRAAPDWQQDAGYEDKHACVMGEIRAMLKAP